jgi:hypothetical protein
MAQGHVASTDCCAFSTLRDGTGLETSPPVSQRSIGKGTVPLVAILWLTTGCLRSVCDEAAGGCPQLRDAGSDALDAGADAGDQDAGADAGPDGGTDAGLDGGCTDNSQCPAGTECDFTCETASANQPFNSYERTGVCNPNPSPCTPGDPQACRAPIATYCDFEGRCVLGVCRRDVMLCPQECTPVDACGCICPFCHPTQGPGQ